MLLIARRATSLTATLKKPAAVAASFETRRGADAYAAKEAGVYTGDAAASKFLPNMPGLNSWNNWHESPAPLTNGHVHTIFAAKCRWTAGVTYARDIIRTEDGGSLALDVVVDASEDVFRSEAGATYEGPRPPARDGRKFLMLLSGLGGGSQDTYVRGQAAAAAARGWRVAVLNMRSCGGSEVTSPRFFSARRGSTDDVRAAVTHVRDAYDPPTLAAIGWSNSGSIVTNALAEQGAGGGLDAACCLAAPLDMPLSSANLEKPFHAAVYDRAIGGSLAEKFRGAQHLYLDAEGRPKPVPAWAGGTFVADVEKGATATSIRAIDEAITAPCFGFPTVDAYYENASADQRLASVQKPLFVLNAADDPIALYRAKPGMDYEALAANENLLMAVTDHGGHLGWCDAADPTGAPGWVQEAALDFLDAAT